MHFLVTALGSYGDVFPMLGLAETLAQRGHQVQVLTNPYFTHEVEALGGVELVPVSTTEEYLRLSRSPALWSPREGVRLVFEFAMGPLLDELYERVASLCRPGETVIAAHALDMASRVARESLGVPVAAVVFAPQPFWSVRRPPRLKPSLLGPGSPAWLARLQYWLADRAMMRPLVTKRVNALRSRVGLAPPIGNLVREFWHATGTTLGLFPDWFAPPQDDWPAGVELVGFPLWDGPAGRPLSPQAEEFLAAGEPPVLFAPGSANQTAAPFFEAAVEACRRLGRRGVLLSRFAPHIPPGLGEAVTHLEFEPLSRLLPRVAAIAHHGGIGTSAQALANGVPQLLHPMAFDQHDNALRLRELGVAEELPPARWTGARVAQKLGRLLGSESVASHAAALAGRCDGPAALGRAADALERLGRRHVDASS